jgi:tubulin-specific chaperone A
MIRFADINIRYKLVFFIIITAIIPLAAAGFYGSHLATKALMDKSFSQLISVQNLRKTELQNIFTQRAGAIRMLTRHPDTQILIKSLISSGRDSKGGRKPSPAINNRKKIYRDYLGQFANTNGYMDLVIINADNGKVLYSVENKIKKDASLYDRKYKETSLRELFDRILETRKGAIIDFKPYLPSGGQQIAFYGEPVFDAKEKPIGVIAILLPPSFLSDIIQSRKGMGNTGESYIVGWSKYNNRFELRSDLQTMGDGKYVTGYFLENTLDYWKDAVRFGVKGKHGTYIDSAGKSVLTAYNKLTVKGVEWYLISKIDKYEVEAPVRKILTLSFIISTILMAMIGLSAFIISRRLTRPIIEDMKFAQAISKGEYDKTLKLDQKDELGALAKALNQMSKTLYESDWLQRGKEGLNEVTRGEHDEEALAQFLIKFVVKHLKAQLGAIYLNDRDILKLKASYAFTDRDGNFNNIKIGEGMVGQAALEKEIIIFNNIDENAPLINYGVGERTASNYMLVPMVYEEIILGVFLVGSIEKFTNLQMEFVKQNMENASILMNTARSQKMIKRLYEQAKEQQEELLKKNDELEIQTIALRESESELQAQQEELRVTNEELEEQTTALKESEAELQAQQEELRVTNEELEGHAKALSEQKDDITKRNSELEKAQEVIEKKAEELEIASKYKSEFLANMSHELRTPLNSILILSQLLSGNKDCNLTEKQIESAATIHASGEDLLNLINEILDLSKIESGKIELLYANIEIENVVKDLLRVFKDVSEQKKVPFNIKVEKDLPKAIYIDHLRLQQILRNLLTNAFKFTKKGSVYLTFTRPPEELADLTGLQANSSIAIEIRDDGIGIPEEQQSAIFEAFQQADGSTSRKYGGTGLGLSISRELAKLLGGSIHLKSKEGEGSTFTVVIPEKDNGLKTEIDKKEDVIGDDKRIDSVPKKEIPAVLSNDEFIAEKPLQENDFVRDDRKDISAGDKVLLIIEDDYNSAKIMRNFAQDRGFKCIVAEDGESGLHFADYYRPSAIVLDIGLPGIDGWAVMERLKNNPEISHIPVHFMSAADGGMDALRMGAIGFLSKPISVDKVDEAFGKIENFISRPVRNLLIVEDDINQSQSIKALIGNGDVKTTVVGTGGEAFQKLSSGWFDCMILDIGLEDMSGFELLEKIHESDSHPMIPVIIYTGRDLTEMEDKKLRKYTENIIIKGVKSPERLLEESALFLHRVETNLPREKQKILKIEHDKDNVFKGKTVLLVDDDMRNVFALSSVLEEKKMQTIIARDGVEAVKKVKEENNIDIVLMDIMMPNMDGYEAMKEIRKDRTNKKLPIIALTAKAMKGDRHKCIQAGANDYLAKPIDTDKLISMLKVWLF